MKSPHIHVPYSRISEYIEFIREQALDLEIYFGSAVMDSVSAADIDHLKSLLDYGPSLSLHAPFMDLSPAAVDSGVRKATVERFTQILEIAGLLRPRTVVFHSGYEKWKYALEVGLWLEKSLETWKPLNRMAQDAGIKIAIENIFEDEPSSLALLMGKMNSENFGICFDTGHFNLFSKTPLEDWIAALHPYFIEFHLHDNDGGSDQHLPMGDGAFDFRKLFGLLEPRDYVLTLEAHSPEHVLRSMDYLRRLKVSKTVADAKSG